MRWLLLAELALRLLLALRIVFSRRAVPVALAWLVVLLAVPFLGLAAYLLVGEVRLGRRRLARYQRLTAGLDERATVFWRGRTQDWTAEVAPYKHIAQVCTEIGGIPPLRGNSVRLLGRPDEMISALVEDIDFATRRCHMLFYIWMHEGAGERVGAALIRAASRGVECRVLVDAVGSRRFLASPLAARMRQAGVRVLAALPASAPRMLLYRIDLRNHRKIAVIDDWVAYAGSQNVTDDTFGYNPRRGIGPWIDAMLRITGPAAQALEVVFLRDWQLESDESLDLADHLPELPIPAEGTTIHVVPSGPATPPFNIREAILTTIYSAREELIMTTPYFVPDEPTKEALMAAAMRGVDVTIVLPERVDARITAAAGRYHYIDLLRAGVKIVHHRTGLLHAKTITIDSDLGLIGSANVDMRSFYLNFEITVFIYDTDQASLLRMLQVSYMEDSTRIFLDEWRRRAAWRRGAENIARLLGPLL